MTNNELWIVTTPTADSTMGDICFKTDPRGFALQVLGGLKPDEIVGWYDRQSDAVSAAAAQLIKVADRLLDEGQRAKASALRLITEAGAR